MIDPVEFGKQVAQVIKEVTEPLLKRIEQLENSQPSPVDIEMIAKTAARMIPAPKDGSDGKDGEDGKDGVDGESVHVESVIASVSASFERRFSDMQLSWERQARDTLEKAIDRMPIPKDGADGKDALPIEAITIEQDERNVVIKLGDVERTIKLDTVIDRGVWRDGDYEKGDAVTYGGSLWIAQVDEPKDAPGTSKEWRLSVKKGRDGRDLRDNTSTVDKSKGVKL